MYYNGKYLQAGQRKVAYWICIWTDKQSSIIPIEKETCPFQESIVNIKYGSRGTGAKWVQWYLNKIMGTNLVIDGIFGNISKQVLIAF